MRTEWQKDEFAILVTRHEVARATQYEALLDILGSEELNQSGGDLTDSSLEAMLSRPNDPQLNDLMTVELQLYAHKAIQAFRIEVEKGGAPGEIMARFREHLNSRGVQKSAGASGRSSLLPQPS